MRPLLKVSAVLNDFEHSTTNVVSGLHSRNTLRTSVGSMLETKCACTAGALADDSAS